VPSSKTLIVPIKPPTKVSTPLDLSSQGTEIKFDLDLNFDPESHGLNNEGWSMSGHY
jgi:hypothetical protein